MIIVLAIAFFVVSISSEHDPTGESFDCTALDVLIESTSSDYSFGNRIP